MSTRSIVAVKLGGGRLFGVYVHFDGDDVNNQLEKIIEQIGYQQAVDSLIEDAPHGWRFIEADMEDESFGQKYDSGDGTYEVEFEEVVEDTTIDYLNVINLDEETLTEYNLYQYRH